MTATTLRPLPHRRVFIARLSRGVISGVGVIAVSLLGGMAGYHWLEHLPWIDAFLNAAMILSGMGPVNALETTGGKVFAGFYAIYSGLALITIAGLMLGPVVHRFLHRFHLEIR